MLPVVEEYATRLGEQISSQGIISDPAEADRRLRAREMCIRDRVRGYLSRLGSE